MLNTCGVILTVEHILTECYQYIINDLKKKNSIPPNMDETLGLDTENITNMITFLRKNLFILYNLANIVI